MRKVLVDRELLNSALKTIHGLAPGRFAVEQELRAAVTAQPAEAEGAVEMGSDAWMALHLLDRLDVSADEEPRVQQVEEIVRRMGAALSAVTAERDRLQSQLAEAQANDRTAMGYLHDVRQLVGGSDFPEMVRNVARMADALPGCVELIETLSPFEDDVLRKAYAAMAAKEA